MPENLVASVALQGAFFGSIYCGARALNRYLRTPTHELVKQRVELQHHDALCDSLTQLALTGNPDLMNTILDEACDVVRASASSCPRAQWVISRKTSHIMKVVHLMLSTSHGVSSPEAYTRMLVCREQVAPQLQSQLDDILHNHILDRCI